MYHCKTRIHQRFQWLIIIINNFSCCLLCSSILESNLVSAPWHSVSLHWPVANSWTTDTTKSREQQKSLVLSLLPVAITSPLSLVLLTKILFFSFFLSFLLWSSGHRTRDTYAYKLHTQTQWNTSTPMFIKWLHPTHSPTPPPPLFSLSLWYCPDLDLIPFQCQLCNWHQFEESNTNPCLSMSCSVHTCLAISLLRSVVAMVYTTLYW